MNNLFKKIATTFVGIAMAVGVGVALGQNEHVVQTKADSTTASWTATSGSLNGSTASITTQGGTSEGTVTDTEGNTWSFTRTNVALVDGKSSGTTFQGSTWMQLGSNNASETLVLTTNEITGTITSINVVCASAGTHKLSASVGSTKYFDEATIALYSGTANATNPDPSGAGTNSINCSLTESGSASASSTSPITITIAAGTRKAMLIRSFSVTYETGEVAPVAVDGVSLDKETLKMEVGDTKQLKATITPNNATNKDVLWDSSDESVATISDNGTITALAEGTTTITVLTDDGNFEATCALTVRNLNYGTAEEPLSVSEVLDLTEELALGNNEFASKIAYMRGVIGTHNAYDDTTYNNYSQSMVWHDETDSTKTFISFHTGVSNNIELTTAQKAANGLSDYTGVVSGYIKNHNGTTLEFAKNNDVSPTISSLQAPVPATYVVTLAPGEGSGDNVELEPVSAGTQIASAPECTFTAPAGKQFLQWEISGVAVEFPYTVNDDVTFVATWEDIPPTIYTVSFNANGGLPEPAAQQVEEGQLANEPDIPVLANNTFLGWFNGQEEFDFATPITDNIELTAHWEEVPEPVTTYTITFNSDGGSDVAPQQVEEGGLAIEPTAPTKAGYNFLGWFIGEQQFDFANTAINEDKTLVAHWEVIPPTTYTVSFDVAGGTPSIPNQTVEEGQKAQKPADPTKENHTFLGWYLGENAFDFNTAINANTALVAHWQDNTPVPQGNSLVLDGTNLGLDLNNKIVDDTEKVIGNITYVIGGGGNSNGTKATASNGGDQAFSENPFILIGKSGAYLYNKTAFANPISKIELVSNGSGSASPSVNVKVDVAFGSAMMDEALTSEGTQLDTMNKVFEFTPENATCTFFRLQVMSAHNAQVQIKITFDGEAPAVINPTSITVSPKTAEVEVGKSTNLTAALEPQGATGTITWETSDDTKATVANGKVTGVAEGEVTITAKCGSLSDTATITVVASQVEPPVDTGILAAGTNASVVTVNGKGGIKAGTGSAGGTATVTVPADAKTLTLYAAAWNGENSTSLTFSGATVNPTSIALTPDTGVKGNSNSFTLTGEESTYLKTVALSGITAETTITLSADKRFVVWNAATSTEGGDTPTPTPTPTTTYTVSFAAGEGATGTMANVTGVSGEYTLPANGFTAPEGKEFAGWKVNGQGDILAVGAKITVSADTQLVAQWKEEATPTPTPVQAGDTLNGEFTGLEIPTTGSTSYAAWENKTGSSGTVYAGVCAVGNSSNDTLGTIQLRSATDKNYSGVINTTSVGKVVSVTITFNAATAANRKVDVYGSNIAYASTQALYSEDTQGTLLGSVTKGDENTTIQVTGDYAYIGIRSNDGALYLDSINIVWEKGGDTPTPTPTTGHTVTFSAGQGGTGTMAPATNISGEYTLPANGFTAPEGKEFAGWQVGNDAEIKQPGAKITVNGDVTVTATWKDAGGDVPPTPVDPTKTLTGIVVEVGNNVVNQGGKLDIKVYATYEGSSEAVEITDYQVSGFDANKVGNQTVTISYGDKSVTIKVLVMDKLGCAGSVFAGSAIISLTTLLGAGLLMLKKKKIK